MSILIAKAISIAAKEFENKLDKGGEPYILHCLYVMNSVKNMSEDVRIAAVFHDIIEDTDVTFEQLKKLGFSDKSLFLIALLTHEKGVTYDDYIRQISNHPEALLIKMADLEHNSSVLRLKGIQQKDLDRISKYHRAYKFLKDNKKI